MIPLHSVKPADPRDLLTRWTVAEMDRHDELRDGVLIESWWDHASGRALGHYAHPRYPNGLLVHSTEDDHRGPNDFATEENREYWWIGLEHCLDYNRDTRWGDDDEDFDDDDDDGQNPGITF